MADEGDNLLADTPPGSEAASPHSSTLIKKVTGGGSQSSVGSATTTTSGKKKHDGVEMTRVVHADLEYWNADKVRQVLQMNDKAELEKRVRVLAGVHD